MPEVPSLKVARLSSAILLGLVLAALGAASLHRKIDSFATVGFTAEPAAGAWQVREVAASETGLAPGDTLLLVDGEVPAGAAGLRERLLAAPSSRLAVLRGAALIDVEYSRPPLRWDFAYLILAATGVVYLAIGLFGLLRTRRGPTGLFFLWCAASAAVYLLSFVPGGPADLLARSSFWVEEVARLLLPPLTLHFFLAFPSPLLGSRQRRLVPSLYLPAALLAVLQADLALNRGGWIFGGLSARALRTLDRLEIAHLIGFAALALAALGWQIARQRAWAERRQLQWIASGLTLGYLPFVLLYAAPWSLGWGSPAWLTVLAVAPLSAVPLTFAWALLRYRLWDVELLLRQAISYTATLLLGVGLFSLLHLGISRGLPEGERLARNTLTFLAGLAVAGVMVPAHRGVRAGLERIRYGQGLRQRRALADLGRELLQERRLPQLCRRLLDSLRESLALERVNLYLVASDGLGLLLPEAGLPPRPHGEDEELWREPFGVLDPARLPGIGPTLPHRLHAAGYRYTFPLSLRGRAVGLLISTPRSDGAPLNSEELALVRSLLDQAALAIENAQLLEALQGRLEEVSRLRHRSEQILESSPAGIAVVDDDGTLVVANRAFGDLVGVAPGRLAGRPLEDVLPVPLPQAGSGLADVSYCDPRGRERYLQVSLAAADDVEGRRVLVVHDVSDRMEMQHALREKERLASLGMLAAGVAHEVNTPITGISSYAQLLLAETAADDPRYELLKKVESQTFRASRIVNNLLELARNRGAEHHPVDLGTVLAEAVAALDSRLAASGATVDWARPRSAVRVLGDEGELLQVFTNLLANAIEAVGDGGRVTLSLGQADGRVRALVEDDGPGIAPEILDKVFRPFFTTKLGSGGTGLGLAISYQIVRRHEGELRAENLSGRGARFTVELPAYRPVERATA